MHVFSHFNVHCQCKQAVRFTIVIIVHSLIVKKFPITQFMPVYCLIIKYVTLCKEYDVCMCIPLHSVFIPCTLPRVKMMVSDFLF